MNKLEAECDKLKILPDFQFGFRGEHSTVQQLIRLFDFCLDAANRKHPTVIVSLDVEAAFDKVRHNALIYKLKNHGFLPHLISNVYEYLPLRSFCVRINNYYSTTQPILAGDPQGGRLCALLCAIYKADMPSPLVDAILTAPICRRHPLRRHFINNHICNRNNRATISNVTPLGRHLAHQIQYFENTSPSCHPPPIK